MTAVIAPPPDAGHLWAPAEWRAVVELAEAEARRIADGLTSGLAPVTHGLATGLLPLDGVVTAARHGGPRAAPTFGVLHSAETPLRAGYAAAIARMFGTTTADKSCHYMTDPAEVWGVLDDLLVAWHCGTGNPASIGLEQAGYAAMSRAEWRSDAAEAQMHNNARVMRAARARFRIGLHWMTDADLLRAHRRQIIGGWATHDQCRRVLGGTSHTDPTPGFDLERQMLIANGEDDMPLSPQDLAAISDAVANRGLGKWPDGTSIEAWETWKAAGLFAVAATKDIAAAVVKALPPASTGGITREQVEAATAAGVRAVLRDGVA